jgi:hypothetical protein
MKIIVHGQCADHKQPIPYAHTQTRSWQNAALKMNLKRFYWWEKR